MAGSTPIYGFPYPQPSDLVANYPALGQQLAEDVEDAIVDSGGLILVNATPFTTQSAISLNNVFSTTYDNYRVIFNLTAASTALTISMRYRVAGSDNSTSNYNRQIHFGLGSTSTAAQSVDQTSAALMGAETSLAAYNNIAFDIYAPNRAQFTSASYLLPLVEGAGFYALHGSIWFKQTTQFDGFSIITNTGTISGAVRVYGYRKS